MTVVMTFANFKGGAGKTTNSVMSAYALAEQGYKVLLIDKDPQANATTLLTRTYANVNEKEPAIEKYLLDGLMDGTFEECVLEVTEQLHFIPTRPNFSLYADFLEELVPGSKKAKHGERMAYFEKVLETVKEDYDFIFIDVPPTISIYTDAALYASDFAMIILQTQDFALEGADTFTNYMVDLVGKYELDLEVLGVLCVIFNTTSKIDAKVIDDAKVIFGEENLFNTQIKHMERLKRYVGEGIAILDHHDKNVMKVYDELTNEMLERLEVFV